MSAAAATLGATTRQARDRRRHWRTDVSYCVDYRVDGRRLVAFTCDLSQGGMMLRRAHGLQAGGQLAFALHVEGAEAPVELRGAVIAVDGGARGPLVRVAFLPGQVEAQAELRRLVEGPFIARLESVCAGSTPPPEKLVALAALYHEVDRHADALQLLHMAAAQRRAQDGAPPMSPAPAGSDLEQARTTLQALRAELANRVQAAEIERQEARQRGEDCTRVLADLDRRMLALRAAEERFANERAAAAQWVQAERLEVTRLRRELELAAEALRQTQLTQLEEVAATEVSDPHSDVWEVTELPPPLPERRPTGRAWPRRS